MFNVTQGATIKKLTLAGTLNITGTSNNSAFISPLVGKATSTIIEDVTSSVKITTDNTVNGTQNSGIRILGGIAAWTNGCTINRCRYNGTMDLDAKDASKIGDRFAGIVGMSQTGTTNISNCLYDGEIITKKGSIIIAGILGKHDSNTVNIKNCLSVGKLTLIGTNGTNKSCGMIYGQNAKTMNNDNNHYTISEFTIDNKTVSDGNYNKDGGFLNDGSNWPALTTTLNGGATVSECNWKIVDGQAYPIPLLYTPVYSTITFDTDGGTEIPSITQEVGTQITRPADPIKEGYNFVDWDPELPETMPENNLTVKAVYSDKPVAPKYTITFDSNGGSSVSSIKLEEGATVTPPANPTKTGYTFSGWDPALPETMPAENITVTATWTVNQYTLTFNTDGGSVINPITQDYGAAITPPENPTKTGYTFDKWEPAIPATMPAEDITVKATYTIAENYTNGFNNNPDCTEDKKYEPATQDTDGYYIIDNGGKLFWFAKYVNSQANGSIAANAKLSNNIDLEGNKSLTSRVFPGIGSANKKYSGTFDGQGYTISNYKRVNNSGITGFINFVTTNAVIKNFTIKGSMTLSHTGSTAFHGGIVAHGDGKATLEDITCSIDITLTTANPRVVGGIVGRINNGSTLNRCRYNGTINAGGTGDQIAGIFANVQAGIKISNCLFDGAIISNDKTTDTSKMRVGGIVASQDGGDIRIENCLTTGTITLADGATTTECGIVYGNLNSSGIVSVTNTYYTTTGSKAGETDFTQIGGSIKDGATVSITQKTSAITWETVTTNLNNPTPESEDCNWKIVSGQAYPIPMPCSEPVQTYTLTFDTAGGSDIEPITKKGGAAITPPENPTKTGYTFDKWEPAIPETMPFENMTVVAQWTVNQYTITFNTDGGSAISPITQNYGTAITAPENPTKAGYTFDHWEPTIPSKMPASNTTVKAIYTKDPGPEHVHNYENGICRNTIGTCGQHYEIPAYTEESGVRTYTINNGGELLYWANAVSKSTNLLNSNVNITESFSIEGDTEKWPDIANYAGTFNGNGNTIYDFKRVNNVTTNTGFGFFNTTNGATIRNLTLNGTLEIQGNNQNNKSCYLSTLVGRAVNTTIEDVTSSVNVSTDENTNGTHDSGIRIFGGITSNADGCTINRCRYNGTITLNAATDEVGDRFAGIVGFTTTGVTNITNCLFDGKIINSKNSYILGGIIAKNTASTVTVINCLSVGTFNLKTITTNCGMILGISNGTKINNWYSTSNLTVNGEKPETDKYNRTGTEITDQTWFEVRAQLDPDNWQIVEGQPYPIPMYHKCEHHYNKFGYCEDCGNPEPIGDPVLNPTDGKYYYQIDHFADLAQFTAMVNTSAKGTEINAQVNNDIDITDLGRPLTTLIGIEGHPYVGTFDGQGHSFKGLNTTSDKRYVGVFQTVGINGTNAAPGIIKNFSVYGELTATYYAERSKNTPLVMGIIGQIYNGVVENVHSFVDFKVTSKTQAQIGGVVGGSLINAGVEGSIDIKSCSYSGTMTLDAYDCIGGIVGYAQHYTDISNCLFIGKIDQQHTPLDVDKNYKDYGNYIGGILGYVNSAPFSGIQNTVIDGYMMTNLTIETEKMLINKNNMNALIGFDGQVNNNKEKYYNNFISYSAEVHYHQLPKDTFKDRLTIEKDETFASGELCARLNKNMNNENPWGQILGYQVNDNLRDPKSPAQRAPFPGYTDPEKTSYKVLTDGDGNYTVDYFFFDDYCDEIAYPSDIKSITVKKIGYHRPYIKKYIPVCLPFDFKEEMKPNASSILYKFNEVIDNQVWFTELESLPTAGTPFIMYVGDSETDWNFTYQTSGTQISLNENNPDGTYKGLFGSYKTTVIGANLFKLHLDGDRFVHTTATSHCYPFRAWLKLDGIDQNGKYSPRLSSYVPMFGSIPQTTTPDENDPFGFATDADDTSDSSTEATQEVVKVIEKDRIIIIRNGVRYNLVGQPIE